MPTRAQLAKIHIAKKELQLTEDIYRDILGLHFKVESAKELTERQADGLLDLFRAKGWKPKAATAIPGSRGISPSVDVSSSAPRQPRRDGSFIAITPGPAAAQQRKVLAMWNALGYSMDKLHVRCKKQFGVDRFEWLTDGRDLHVLITDLAKRQGSYDK